MSIESLIAHYGLAALFVGAGLEGEAVVIAGGVLAHQGLVSLPGAIIAGIAGSFTADQLWFAAGRRFRDARFVQRITRKAAFARALGILERHPTGFIIAFRFIYGIRTVSPIAIGTSKVPARTFLPLNAFAAAVWGSAFTTLGYLFGSGIERFLGKYKPHGHTLVLILIGVVAVGAVIGGIHWWRQRESATEDKAGERPGETTE
jgi:membrane protein DedA with SNARE-associated domain